MLEQEAINTYRKTNVTIFSPCFQFCERSKENIQKYDYADTKFLWMIHSINLIKFCGVTTVLKCMVSFMFTDLLPAPPLSTIFTMWTEGR